MMRQLVGTGILVGAGLVPGVAHADRGAGTVEPCTIRYGAVTAGRHWEQVINATSPITAEEPLVTPGVYPNGGAIVSGRFVSEPFPGDIRRHGENVINGSLFHTSYGIWVDGSMTPGSLRQNRIGGGWTPFTFLEKTTYVRGSFYRTARYGLRNDGRLFRWNTVGNGRTTVASVPGFGAVKTMALISKTATYDTFLANLKGGSLYTIRIPSTTQLKPVVTQIRKSTWQGFEHLLASKCGTQSTLLLGVDLETRSGYLYAVGHANGTATPIKSLGKVPRNFTDSTVFSWVPIPEFDQLNGD